MSYKRITNLYRHLIHANHTLSGKDASRLQRLILSDQQISRSERKFIHKVVHDDKCSSEAAAVLNELLNRAEAEVVAG